MSNQISEELPARKHPQANAAGGGGGDAPAPKGGGDAPKSKEGGGDKAKGGTEENSEKRIRQAVYDIRYRARREDIDLRQAFSQYMSNSNLSQQERTAVRAKLFGKEGGGDVAERYSDAGQLVSDSVAKALNKVFVEGIDKEMELSYLEELQADPATKYQVRVTDEKTGRTYVRLADRSKITQLRQNPNIKSVEMTDHGDPYEGTKRAKKDYDGDGKKESPSKEHAGSVHNAIQRAKGGKPDGQDTRKEEYLADAIGAHSDGHVALMEPEEEVQDKPVDVMKGKNKIKINPKIGESYDKKVKDKNEKDPNGEAEDPLNTVGCKDPDPRSMKTKYSLMRNKLRARGLNMSHELEGEDLVEEFINESVDLAADYFIKEGINEDGLEKIVDLVGLEDFTEFVLDLPQNLNEERSATKAPKRDYEKVKAAVYKKDAERKEKGTGEYSTTKAAKAKYGDEEAPGVLTKAPEKKAESKPTPKPKSTPAVKVATATKTAKKTQVSTSSDKKGLVSKIKGFVSKGIERHQKAREAGRVPEARAKEFGKGVASGVKTVVNVARVAHGVATNKTPASKTTQKATTKAQKAADKDGDGKVRTVDASYKPEAPAISEDLLNKMSRFMPKKSQELDELNRYEKETGKSSGGAGTYRGGVNTPRKGTPTKTGGSDDKMVHFGKGLVRKAEGRPTGQTRSSYDKRGEENNTPSPAQRIKKHLEDKRRNERRPTQGRYPQDDEKAERQYQANKHTKKHEKNYPNSSVVSGTVPGGKGVK